jgi:hypothetical protein
MDAFEQVVSEILWMKGLWVRTSVKVNLEPKDKETIGKPTSPRWELDIVAYSGRDNLLSTFFTCCTFTRQTSNPRASRI